MWKTKPIIVQLAGIPVALRFSSLRAYQFSLGCVALCLVLAGWLLGSGLLALKAMFSPSVEMSRSVAEISPQWKQWSLMTDTISRSFGERWTTMSSAYAGTSLTDIHTGATKGALHE